MPKYTTQTIFGPKGNCFSAVVADIFGIPICEAFYIFKKRRQKSWVGAMNAWAAKKGFAALFISPKSGLVPTGLHVMVGTTVRKTHHAVLGKNGTMVHDPHPDRSGIIKIDYYVVFIPLGATLDHFVRFDARRHRKLRLGSKPR